MLYEVITIGFDAYAKRVTEAFQTAKIEIVSLHTVTDTHRMVESAELIVVGLRALPENMISAALGFAESQRCAEFWLAEKRDQCRRARAFVRNNFV